jgi:hypothetical protein
MRAFGNRDESIIRQYIDPKYHVGKTQLKRMRKQLEPLADYKHVSDTTNVYFMPPALLTLVEDISIGIESYVNDQYVENKKNAYNKSSSLTDEQISDNIDKIIEVIRQITPKVTFKEPSLKCSNILLYVLFNTASEIMVAFIQACSLKQLCALASYDTLEICINQSTTMYNFLKYTIEMKHNEIFVYMINKQYDTAAKYYKNGVLFGGLNFIVTILPAIAISDNLVLLKFMGLMYRKYKTLVGSSEFELLMHRWQCNIRSALERAAHASSIEVYKWLYKHCDRSPRATVDDVAIVGEYNSINNLLNASKSNSKVLAFLLSKHTFIEPILQIAITNASTNGCLDNVVILMDTIIKSDYDYAKACDLVYKHNVTRVLLIDMFIINATSMS